MKKPISIWLPLLACLLFLSTVVFTKDKKSPPSERDKRPVALSEQATPRATILKTPPEIPREVRGLWVVRDTLTTPEKIKEAVQHAKASNFNTLIVQVRGRGDAFYHSRWEPRADELKDTSEGFDPLALVIQEAHAVGLTVHAWMNVSYISNLDPLPTAPNHIVNQHPEWLMVHRGVAARLLRMDPRDPQYLQLLVKQISQDRSEIEGLYVSLAMPEVKEHIYNVAMDILEHYDIDGLHLDYIRHASPAFDYNRVTLARFTAELDKTLTSGERRLLSSVATTDPLIYTTVFPDRWAQFRRDQVTEVVERIYHGIKARKPHVLLTAAVFADDENASNARFQDWKLWLDRGILDGICPMAYTSDTETFKRQIEKALSYSMGHQIWAGIGAYQINVESAIEKIELARRIGVEGEVLFSYGAMVKPSPTNPSADYLEKLKSTVYKYPTVSLFPPNGK